MRTYTGLPPKLLCNYIFTCTVRPIRGLVVPGSSTGFCCSIHGEQNTASYYNNRRLYCIRVSGHGEAKRAPLLQGGSSRAQAATNAISRSNSVAPTPSRGHHGVISKACPERNLHRPLISGAAQPPHPTCCNFKGARLEGVFSTQWRPQLLTVFRFM